MSRRGGTPQLTIRVGGLMPHLDCRIHTTPDATSRAQVLQRDAHRYYELLAIGLREVRAAGFTVGELSAICDVLNGTLILWELDAGDGPRPRMTPESVATAITAELVDAARLTGLGEKWGIDPVGLARRLREDLTPLAVWALVDAVERARRGSTVPRPRTCCERWGCCDRHRDSDRPASSPCRGRP